ncbi:unnamed protein product [Rhizophagus irregularis]|nr:unnamed protein product [Rhizophagus irregularis]
MIFCIQLKSIMIVENLYHEAREELKRIKLTSISSEKIRLMSNKNNLIVLNIDDYHNIHTLRRPDTTTTSSALHFVAILMKSSSQVSAIPFNNVTNQLIQNPKELISVI